MSPVRVLSHYGQAMTIDQCPGCGGIWFDESELFRARPGEADHIENISADALRAPTPVVTEALTCPRDRARLQTFSDPLFPAGIVLARCPACSGFWLNRGGFTGYQKAREQRRAARQAAAEDASFQSGVARVIAEYPAGSSVWGRIGAFLSSPVDIMTAPESPPPEADKVRNAAGTLLDLVLTLFRLFVLR